MKKPKWLMRKKKKKNLQLLEKIQKIAFCTLAVAVSALPAVFMNSIYGYLPVITVAIAIGVSLGYLFLLKRSLLYEELSDLSNCERGTEIDFTVKIKNKFLLVFPKLEAYFYISDLFGEDDTVTNAVITLAPKEERSFDFSVRFEHIGTYNAGLKKLKIHDLFGLFSWTILNTKEYQIHVAPKVFDVAELQISNTAMTESQKMIVPTVIDGSDYAGVREYVWGDPIKTIHWKLSARTDTYMTKQFESYGTVGIDILLDFFSPPYDTDLLMSIFDAVVETGLSIGSYAEENGMDYEIIYWNKKEEKKRFNSGHYADFVEMIDDMPKISTDQGRQRAAELLEEETNARYSQGNLALCTANVSEDLVNALVQTKNRRKNPLLFAIVPDALEGQERKQFLKPLRTLDQAKIPYYILSSAEELSGGGNK